MDRQGRTRCRRLWVRKVECSIIRQQGAFADWSFHIRKRDDRSPVCELLPAKRKRGVRVRLRCVRAVWREHKTRTLYGAYQKYIGVEDLCAKITKTTSLSPGRPTVKRTGYCLATVLSGNVRREISSSLGAVLRGSGGRPFETDDINGVGARQQNNLKSREKRQTGWWTGAHRLPASNEALVPAFVYHRFGRRPRTTVISTVRDEVAKVASMPPATAMAKAPVVPVAPRAKR